MSMAERFRRIPVGQKVTVLYRLAEGGMSEAVGPLVERDDDSFTVETRRRGSVRIPYAAVLSGRVVPQ